MSTCVGLFYPNRLGYQIHCAFILTFFVKQSYWIIDGTLTGTTNPGQSGAGINCNEGFLPPPQSSRTVALSSGGVKSLCLDSRMKKSTRKKGLGRRRKWRRRKWRRKRRRRRRKRWRRRRKGLKQKEKIHSNQICNIAQTLATDLWSIKSINHNGSDRYLKKKREMIWFGLVSLFNGISTFVGYLMPKPSRRTAIVLFNP